MKLETLHDLYIEELRDLYDAEQQILKTLPRMAKAATADDLKSAFENHLDVTQEQIGRLEEIFERHGIKPKGKKCKAMEGLIAEAKELIEGDADPEVRDAALIAAAQRIEHYEIAGYGCVRTYAEQMEHDEDEELLAQTLDEEKETDEELTDIAITCINLEAGDEEDEDEEGEDEEELEEDDEGEEEEDDEEEEEAEDKRPPRGRASR